MNSFSDVDVNGGAVLRFGFDRDFPAGTTLSSITFEVEVLRGTDPTPLQLLSGSFVVDGLDVVQPVVGRVANVLYHIRCRAVDQATGQPRVVAGNLKVVRK